MNVLLLDTSFAAAPIYEALISMEHSVWVMGNRANDVLAVRAEGKWISGDYSQLEAVQQYCDELKIEAIVPGCTDVSIETCTQVKLAENRCDTELVNRTLADKGLFRELCEELDLPSPKVVLNDSFPQKGEFICKPVDSFSGRGVSKFDGTSKTALENAIALAEPEGTAYVIENFHQGELYSCSAFVKNQTLEQPFYVREGGAVNVYAVDTSYVVTDLPGEVMSVLEDALGKLCTRLELCDGLLHTQFILEQGKPYIIEMARRCPGDLYSLLIEYSTGVPYAAKFAAAFTGDAVSECSSKSSSIVRHTIKSSEDCVYGGVEFEAPLPVRANFPLMSIGGKLSVDGNNRAGILFAEVSKPDQMEVLYDRFLEQRVYSIT
jgi:hypothetical protein